MGIPGFAVRVVAVEWLSHRKSITPRCGVIAFFDNLRALREREDGE